MGKSHILVIPYPAQGHVIPLFELSQSLINQGFKVTFVNTEFNHNRVFNALLDKDCLGDQLSLVSIPDGLEPWEDRNDMGKFFMSIAKVMPAKLEELIERIKERITCVIADQVMGWALEVAAKKDIPRAAFWAPSAALLCLTFSIPKLIDDGIINEFGTPTKRQIIQLAPGMPPMNTADFAWCCIGDLPTQIIGFNLAVNNVKSTKLADWIICNSAYDLEPGSFTYSPNIRPIGPLFATNRIGNQIGCFWPEDASCMKWLDQQPSNSVIYAAFGSHTKLGQAQFQELALGLELSNRPFLWVVRPDFINQANDVYPDGFQERTASRGHVVGWTPQLKVLNHPSVACFMSHCGWNSTLEGIGNGVPLLCWPYFADHFLIESYICDTWKVGLRFNRDVNGLITKEEIKNKVEHLVGDLGYKGRVLDLKEKILMSVSEDGQSTKNFQSFCEWIKMKSI